MSANWYVLHSKPNKEDFLCNQLLSAGLESYCPRLNVQPVNPRARRSQPYFPGYVFVRLDLNEVRLSSLDWLPGATGFVCFDRQPAEVPDRLVRTIRRRVDEIRARDSQWLGNLKPGTPVVIRDGPFAGYEAIFDGRASGNERVRVLLTLLQKRQLPLDMAAAQIQQPVGA